MADLERTYSNIPFEKLVSAARWGLESNGLEITDSLNPAPKTTKLIGFKAKHGTAEVLIIDQAPQINIRLKLFFNKKSPEEEFLSAFWEKLEIEAGLKVVDAREELDALRQGDFHTYHLKQKVTIDSVVDQARWSLEDMGLRITESLRPDPLNASVKGTGKIGNQKTDVSLILKGEKDILIVRLSHTLKLKDKDTDELNAITRLWNKFHLLLGDSLEEEAERIEVQKHRSAGDIAAIRNLTDFWAKIVQRDKDLTTMVSEQVKESSQIDVVAGSLKAFGQARIPWSLSPMLQIALQSVKGKSVNYLVDISCIKVEDTLVHPALFTFVRMGPYPVSKELVITDKFYVTYQGMEFTDEMGTHLNNEEPLLAKRLRETYSQEPLLHYFQELTLLDKDGSKYKKVLNYFLKDPIQIFNSVIGGSEQSIILARAFLSPDGKITPVPSTFLRLLDQIVESIDRYCTKTGAFPAINGVDDSGKPSIDTILNRCPYCNWILTPGKKVCPMCRKDLPSIETAINPPPSPPSPQEIDSKNIQIEISTTSSQNPNSVVPLPLDGINQRITEINFQVQGLQSVLTDLQAAFTTGRIKFEQYQASNDQYVQQIGKLQDEKRQLERKKFEMEFKLS